MAENPDIPDLSSLDWLEGETPERVVRWAVERFFPDLALACSFGGASGTVLLDLVARVEPCVPVFYLDTGFLFPETLAARDAAAAHYGIEPVAVRPALSPDEQAAVYGDRLWERDPDLCCRLRKVEPNTRFLAGKRAWITGIRRDQAGTRREVPVAAWDAKFGLVKINPLAAWSEKQVWDYIVARDLPYNRLHDVGYKSIGCTHCTRAVGAGAGLRDGRWSGTGKVECGLHK